ncbi:MAG: hypothetical protein ACK4ZI_18455 [Microcystis sp.]
MTDIHARMLAKPVFVVTRLKKNGIKIEDKFLKQFSHNHFCDFLSFMVSSSSYSKRANAIRPYNKQYYCANGRGASRAPKMS